MKILLLFFIKMYWFLIPAKKRKKCLFKKSCSHFVFDIAKKEGLVKGLKALKYRWKHCRPGYYIINGVAGKILISAHNEVFDKNEIAERLIDSKQ